MQEVSCIKKHIYVPYGHVWKYYIFFVFLLKKNHRITSVSVQTRLTEMCFALTSERSKNISDKHISQHLFLNIRHQTMEDSGPWETGTNEVSPRALRDSRGHCAGETTKAEPDIFYELRRRSWDSRGTKSAVVHRTDCREWERYMEGENSGDLHRVFSVLLNYSSQQMYEKSSKV